MGLKIGILIISLGTFEIFSIAATHPSTASEIKGEEIIQKYYETIGGQKAISQVSDLRITGFFSAKGVGENKWGIKGTFEELRTTDTYRLSVFYYADTLLAVMRAQKFRFVDQPGLSDYIFMEGIRTRAESPIQFTNVKAIGLDHFDKVKNEYSVELFDVDSTKWQVFFNAQTFLPNRAVKNQKITLLQRYCNFTFEYFDFHEVSGLILPHRIIKTACDIGTVTYFVENYEVIDEPFDRKLFDVKIYKRLLTGIGRGHFTRVAPADESTGSLGKEEQRDYTKLVEFVKQRHLGEEKALYQNVGKRFPIFSTITINGVKISNKTLKGKATLVNFWATWCGSCVRAMPQLAEFIGKAPNDKLQVLGVSLDNDREALEMFIASHPEFNWPQIIDVKHSLFEKIGGFAVPTYILLDSEGIIRNVYLGAKPVMYKEIEILINDE